MAVRVGDNLKPSNDSTEFPVAFGDVIWLNKDKTGATENYSDLQTMYNNDELGGGSSIQVDTMPIASEYPNKTVQYVGESGTYQNGYFYQSTSDEQDPPTYSWVQKNVQPSNATATDVSYDNTTSELVATNVQDAIDEIKGGLGTASGKNFTDLVRPNSHELVESGSVYSAINNALSSIYTPRGELTCAELTSNLLIEDNVGNIYTMSDSGTTSALFINGAGLTINIGDNVGIIKASADTYFFNYMGNAFDLTDYQKKDLSSPIAGASTVEGAIAQNTSDIEQNTANFANEFSATSSYAVGDFVTYNNVLYRCTVQHTASAWNSSHFTATSVGSEIKSEATKSISGITISQQPATLQGCWIARFGKVVQMRVALSGASMTTASATTLKLTFPSSVPKPVMEVWGVNDHYTSEVDETAALRFTTGGDMYIFTTMDHSPLTNATVNIGVVYLTNE